MMLGARELHANMEAAGYDPVSAMPPDKAPPGLPMRVYDFTKQHNERRRPPHRFAFHMYACRKTQQGRVWIRCIDCDWLQEM